MRLYLGMDDEGFGVVPESESECGVLLRTWKDKGWRLSTGRDSHPGP